MISRGAMFAQAARGPVLMITLGVLFALQQAGVLPFSRSWPLLIIAIGVMKLLERMWAGPTAYGPPVAGGGAYPPPNYPPGNQPPSSYPPAGVPPQGRPQP